MWIYLPLVAIGLINGVGVLVWAISSFGNGIVYHLGWAMCRFLAQGDVCEGNLSVAVIHITLAAIVLMPSQLFILRSSVNWPLALHLTFSQQLGLYVGMYILFLIESVWLGRTLGLLFFLVALHLAITESTTVSKSPISSHTSIITEQSEEEHRYEVDTWERRGLVWLTGISSGLFSGLFATGGPPLMLFVAYQKIQSRECRATISFCDLINNSGRMIFLLFFQKKINLWSVKYGYTFEVLSVSIVVSLLLGNELAKLINPRIFRRILIVLLAFGSVFISVSGCTWQQVVIISGSGATVLLFAVVIARSNICCGKHLLIGSLQDTENNQSNSSSSVELKATCIGSQVYPFSLGLLLLLLPFSSLETNYSFQSSIISNPDADPDNDPDLDSNQNQTLAFLYSPMVDPGGSYEQ